MKKLFVFLSLALLITACAPKINLNRLSGKPGPYAPIIEDDGVLFQIYVPNATLVNLAGSFNGWSDWTTPLEDQGDGLWTLKVELDEGKRYQYKYVVDGYWIADPDNPETSPDGFGGVNSIIDLK